MLQAVRQQQHPAMEGDRQKLLLPEKVTNHHHGETEKFLRQLHLVEQNSSVLFQLVLVECSRLIQPQSVLFGRLFERFTLFQSFRYCFQMAGTAAFALFSDGRGVVIKIRLVAGFQVSLGWRRF